MIFNVLPFLYLGIVYNIANDNYWAVVCIYALSIPVACYDVWAKPKNWKRDVLAYVSTLTCTALSVVILHYVTTIDSDPILFILTVLFCCITAVPTLLYLALSEKK